MENVYTLEIELTNKNNRSYFNIKQPAEQDLSLNDVRLMLSGAISLIIKSHDNQSEALRKVIKHLEDEFISTDSFEDLESKFKKL